VIYITDFASMKLLRLHEYSRLAERCHMMINSRYLASGAPITCEHCKKPFPVVNGHVEAWRSSTGKYFCDEFCAEDKEDASFQDHRRAS